VAGLREHPPAVATTPHGGPEELFGLSAVRIEGTGADAVARAEMVTGPWLRHESGEAAAGSLGVLLDDVLGQAVLIARTEHQWSVTTELAFDLLAPVPVDGTTVRAHARLEAIDAGGGVARGRVVDEAGRTLALGATWGRLIDTVPAGVVGARPVEPVGDRGRSLAELLRIRAGERPGSWVVPSRPALGNPAGVMHGGVLACVAEMAAHAALGPDRGALTTASLHAFYLRPAVGDMAVDAEVVHRGRSLAVVEVVARGASGKPCMRATVGSRSAE
jgi:uncharacterized protein (TIGR00369 family)